MIKQTSDILIKFMEMYNSLDEDKRKEYDDLEVWNTILNLFNNGNQVYSMASSEFDLGLDLSNNKIYLSGQIHEHDGIIFHQKLDIIKKLSPKYEDQETEIKLILDSSGGDVYSMFTIVDSIQIFPHKISVIGFGNIMSAASLILAAGTGPRLLAPNTSIMVHQMSASLDGNSDALKSNAKQIEQLEERWLELYSKFTGKSKSWWRTKMQKDFFIDAKSAIRYGLADDLLTKENYYE